MERLVVDDSDHHSCIYYAEHDESCWMRYEDVIEGVLRRVSNGIGVPQLDTRDQEHDAIITQHQRNAIRDTYASLPALPASMTIVVANSTARLHGESVHIGSHVSIELILVDEIG